MKNYETTNFLQDVLEASRKTPVVVDFWAEWCGPCRILGPILERLHEQDGDRWILVKVDTDRHQEIAGQYGVKGIPNVKLFVDGKVANEFTGSLPERMVRQWLDSSLPDVFRVELKNARKFIDEGDEANGVAVLEQVLGKDPNHEAARVLLAKHILLDDFERAGELVAGIEEDSPHFSLVDAIRTVLEMREKYTNPEILPDGPGKTSYAAALKELVAGNYDPAIVHFIEVLRTDRRYDNDGARRASVALFTLLGEENPATRNHRRAFAGALNV